GRCGTHEVGVPRARVTGTAARRGIVVDRRDARRGCWETAPARALDEKRHPERTERQPEKIACCHFSLLVLAAGCAGVLGGDSPVEETCYVSGSRGLPPRAAGDVAPVARRPRCQRNVVGAAGARLDPSAATGAWSRRHASRSGRRRPVIPYFELREIPLGGGRSLAAFGTLVALGIFAGAWFAERRARVVGVPPQEIPAAILSAVVPGLLLAHLVALLPQVGGTLAWSPRVVLEFWNGMSSFGGFAGALLGLTVYYWRSPRSWLLTADVLVQALVVGWVFGRLGCTLVHDHLGRPSEFLLAIRFPAGSRHD